MTTPAAVLTIERKQKLIAFIDGFASVEAATAAGEAAAKSNAFFAEFADAAAATAAGEELQALVELELNSITKASLILDDHEDRIVALEGAP
jgi:hypothetical protein